MLTLLSILDKLLTLIQGWVIIKKEKDAQAQNDQVEVAPADWFNDHFDSLHTYHSKATSPQTDPQRDTE